MGDEDPIPWEYVAGPGQDQDGLTLQSNFAEFKKVCKSCDFTEDKITDWFGVNNANRDRGKKLFRGGHVDLSTLRARAGRMIVSGDELILFQAVVTASQRARAYNAVLAYNKTTGQILRSPASTGECVVHLGPGCSHQFAIGCTIVAVTHVRGEEEMKVFPPT
mgnify:FL=1